MRLLFSKLGLTNNLCEGINISWGVIVSAIGGAISMYSVYAWSFEPVNEPDDVDSGY